MTTVATAMRVTLHGGRAILRNEQGDEIGRVVALEIELDTCPNLSADPGATGNSKRSEATNVGEKKPSKEAEQIVEAWQHYVAVTGSKRVLDDKRRRVIRQAIKATDLDRVKLAIVGLSRSPWHNGQNPEGKKYLEIRYALKGIGDESDDERIDKMCDVAVVHDPIRDGVDPVRVERWLDHVRYTAVRPNSERERAITALNALRAAGFSVTKIDRAPWVVIA